MTTTDSHYNQARDLLRGSEDTDPESAILMVAQAQVHATLALVEATRESR